MTRFPSRESFVDVITNGKFHYLWLNQLLFQLSLGLLNFSIIILLRQLTGSSTIISIFVMTVILPTVLFGVFAGVVADILDRRKIILAVDLGLAAMMTLYILFANNIPILLLLSLLFNSIGQFFIPAEAASIPMVVGKKQIFIANSLFSFTLYGGQFLGFSVAGFIILKYGYDAIFILVSLNLLLASVFTRFLPQLLPTQNEMRLDWDEVKILFSKTLIRVREGIQFIVSNVRILSSIVVLAGVQGVVGILAALSTGYAENVLKIRAADASYTTIVPVGLGLIIGALSVGKFGKSISRRSLIASGVLFAGVLLTLIGSLPAVVSSIAGIEFFTGPIRTYTNIEVVPITTTLSFLGFWLGFSVTPILIPAHTVIQENTPDSIRGRVYSVLMILVSTMAAIPIVIAGGLADILGIATVFVWVGVFVTISGIGLLLLPVLRTYLPSWARF